MICRSAFLLSFGSCTIFPYFQNRSCESNEPIEGLCKREKVPFRQLMVILELRCSDDYAPFISQGIIEEYLKLFMNKLREKSEKDDLDLSDYEVCLTGALSPFDVCIYPLENGLQRDIQYVHRSLLSTGSQRCTLVSSIQRASSEYSQYLRVGLSLQGKNDRVSHQLPFSTIRTLLQLKICALDAPMQAYLEETIKIRLKTDIDDAFSLYGSLFNDSADIQLKLVEDFCEFVKKLADSMTSIGNYDKLFAIFGVAYIKVCFFEENNASDRVGSVGSNFLFFN